MKRCQPTNRLRRNGVAPLELVMGMPFLMGIFAMLLSVGFVSLKKGKVVANARHEVWQQRTEARNDDGTKPLSVTGANNDTLGLIEGQTEGTVGVFSWLGMGDSVTTQGRAAVLAGSWDHRQVDDFESSGPHMSIIERMAGGSGDISKLGVGLLGMLAGEAGLPNQDKINEAGEDVKKAEQQAEEKREEMEAEIAKLEAELAELKEQRAQLVRDRDAKQADLDRKNQELADLRKAAATQNPVPANTQSRIEQLEEETGRLRGEIAELNGLIRQKDGQIRVKQQQVDDAHAARDQANAEIEKMN